MSGIVRLRLEGVEQASGYGLNLRFESPILRAGRPPRLDGFRRDWSESAVRSRGGGGSRGRRTFCAVGNPRPLYILRAKWSCALPLSGLRPPRNVDLRVEEGFVGAGRGRALRFERTATTRIVPQVYALYANYPNPSIQSTPKKPRSRPTNRGRHLNSSKSSRAVGLALCGPLTTTTI